LESPPPPHTHITPGLSVRSEPALKPIELLLARKSAEHQQRWQSLGPQTQPPPLAPPRIFCRPTAMSPTLYRYIRAADHSAAAVPFAREHRLHYLTHDIHKAQTRRVARPNAHSTRCAKHFGLSGPWGSHSDMSSAKADAAGPVCRTTRWPDADRNILPPPHQPRPQNPAWRFVGAPGQL
jgi:hypothetical protein